MRKRIARISAAVAAFGALAVGGSALATAAQHHPAAKQHAAVHQAKQKTAKSGEVPGTEAKDSGSESESASEADTDASGQAAACKAAGIDPNADNVQYDDQTGTCSLDNGSNDGQ